MDTLEFWQLKIIQFFHDPPAKVFAFASGSGGHVGVARRLQQLFLQLRTPRWRRRPATPPDWAAAGADRPMLAVPRGSGKAPLGTVHWHKRPLAIHPLAAGYQLHLTGQAGLKRIADIFEDEEAEGDQETLPDKDFSIDDEGKPERNLLEEQRIIIEKLSIISSDWGDSESLVEGYLTLWRRFRDDLISLHPYDPLWMELPADSRCPDHAIWDHLQVATSLAFLTDHKMYQEVRAEGAREPWMLRFSIGPVQAFIGQARTTRDLWISSYLLSDLIWHGMQPIVERYGPDCIVYPHLNGNPRADCWLTENHRQALRDEVAPNSFAAVLPDVFVALVPQGGEGHLVSIKDLAKSARDALEARWQALAEAVKTWIQQTVRPHGGDGWTRIWDRQAGHCPIQATWVAIPWLPLERIKDAGSLRGPALPTRSGVAMAPPSAADREAIESRAGRLAAWVPATVWSHYELARSVFANSHLGFHQIERGFDYALTHHQLTVRHSLREATAQTGSQSAEPGEKCTLCGQREVLHNGAENQSLAQQKASAKTFWANEKLDPDETGEERLCTVCSIKRFLVDADQTGNVFNKLWAGFDAERQKTRDRDGRLRVPFPSTATIAAQEFLEKLLCEPKLNRAAAAVVEACARASLPKTSFPRALPRLSALSRAISSADAAFLEYEAEDVLFPEVLEGKARGKDALGEDQQADRLRDLGEQVAVLRRDASKAGLGSPKTKVAVIRLDGDRMGQLLLGAEESIDTRWRDILHPTALERLEGTEDRSGNKHLLEAGWAYLLDSKRLMGPSLHAFISRALAHFSHRIVPWVVEQEFSGRLIYAGGDDVLCLAPADEAIDLAARLQQLFSAAWVVDTTPPEKTAAGAPAPPGERLRDQWGWRRSDWTGTYNQAEARGRFVIPLPEDADGTRAAIELGTAGQQVAAHTATTDPPNAMEVRGALIPMLGPKASLSAGIAVGHYKTPLSVLLRRSSDLIDLAKSQGRRAVAVGHASRGGEKTAFSLPWDVSLDGRFLSAQALFRSVIKGFEKGSLPGRLPYKLRQVGHSLRCALQVIETRNASADARQVERDRVIQGLFASCFERPPNPAAPGSEAALVLWRRGIETNGWALPEAEDGAYGCHRDGPETRYTDGLLVCRELARGDPEHGDAL